MPHDAASCRQHSSASSKASSPRPPASPSPGPTPTDPNGYALGVIQLTYKPIGTVWWYRGGTLGYRFEPFYFPRSGLIVALAVNSSVDSNHDGLFTTAVSVYQTLQKAAGAQAG